MIKNYDIISQHIPKVIENRPGDNELKLDIFSRLQRERIIFLTEELDTHASNVICAQLLLLDSDDSEKDIMFYINSPGGSVLDGLAIYDTMQHIRAPISTLCIGQAASMASILLLAGTKGKRFAVQNARIMIHQGSGGTEGQASDIEIYTAELLRLEHLINEIMQKHTGQTLKNLEKDQQRDNYMTPQQALNYGIIDQVI